MFSLRFTGFCLIYVFISALALPGGAWAGKVKPMNLEELVARAELIFEGVCSKVDTGDDPETGLPSTWYTFRVVDGLKGRPGEEFVLKQFGGISEEGRRLTGPNVSYEQDERVVLFLHGESQIGFSSAVGLHQGKFSVREIPETGVRYVTNGMPSMVLFEKMERRSPAVDARGVKLSGAGAMRSSRLASEDFKALVRELAERQAGGETRPPQEDR